MQFQVPQFIEVEDKIFGPLTLKQFIYVVGGCGLSVMFYLFMPLYIGIFFILPIMAFSLALAFYNFNNKPFIFVVEAAAKYLVSSRLYIWRKEEIAVETSKQAEAPTAPNTEPPLPNIHRSKLKDISLSLDTKADPKMGTTEAAKV